MKANVSRIVISLAAAMLAPSLAGAHGVQTQLIYNAVQNRIDTRSLIATSTNPFGQPVPINSVTAQRRAYVEPLYLSPIGAGTGWYARPDPAANAAGVPDHPSGPGPAYEYDDLLPGTGWSFNNSTTLPNLQGTTFTYRLLDGLKQWDGTSFVDPGTEQVQLIASDGTTTFTPSATNNVTSSDAGPGVGTLSFAVSASKSTNPHSSMSVRLLGDGTTLSEPDDGIYLVKLAIGTSATLNGTPVGDSDPFYFVLTKNASYAQASAAVQTLGVAPALVQGQLPEPTAIATIGGLAVAASRRRGATGEAPLTRARA